MQLLSIIIILKAEEIFAPRQLGANSYVNTGQGNQIFDNEHEATRQSDGR